MKNLIETVNEILHEKRIALPKDINKNLLIAQTIQSKQIEFEEDEELLYGNVYIGDTKSGESIIIFYSFDRGSQSLISKPIKDKKYAKKVFDSVLVDGMTYKKISQAITNLK